MLCRRRGGAGAIAQGSGRREGPRHADGDARNSTRTDNRAAPATLTLHLDVSIPRQAQDRYVAKNAFASATEATDNVAWSLLKNQVVTSSMNTWPPLAGCLLQVAARATVTTPPSRTATISPTVSETALVALAPRLATPAQSQGLTYAHYSTRNALTARTKRYGLTSCSTGLKTQTV